MRRALLLLGALAPLACGATCESLASLTLANTTLTAENLSAYCRVAAVVKPVADSEIHVEIWLPPPQQWNGKFLGTGNGGYSSALSNAEMHAALQKGYATAGSNTGHEGGDLKFGAGHPEKIRDWAYRATHVMTATAKQVVGAYYDRAAAHAYFEGCSTGGHQALMEAQRYPADYDGIVAGDPGNNRIRLNAGFLWSWLAAQDLPAAKLPILNRAVVEACDAADGLKDGLISDPRRCRFDPGVLECKNGDGPQCLTAAQVEAARKVYEGAHDPRTGERIFAGWARGSEALGGRGGGWAAYFAGQPEPARPDFWRYWVFDNPEWNPRTFDFDRDIATADAKVGYIDANNPDLSAFQRDKGKLLLYHGWADPVVPPEDGIRYYESVEHAMGGTANVHSFFRLFMAPGMGHCGGGPGPNTFDALSALDQWVTGGVAPEMMIASHSTSGTVDRTRPLCAYPKVAQYNGTGSVDDAASFTCAVER
ncbi:MAG TPA: tannase/feruloyl esterase family alpha/beta hydrolase [Bryobacteraceae bacterium]|jgi:feruloyl esterase|nr:tannase/feruloyl esterase family alpha/beta hydrolase [Bryobacteraceae bacterium]